MNEVFKTLSEVDKIFRDGDVYFISIYYTSLFKKYDIRVFDEDHKYKCTIHNVSSFDFRMLRKVYANVYYWCEEIEEMFPTMHAQQAKK